LPASKSEKISRLAPAPPRGEKLTSQYFTKQTEDSRDSDNCPLAVHENSLGFPEI
jgi:hypothetical protein